MLVIAESISKSKNCSAPPYFVFAGFTDEEKGLVGSAFYVHQLSKQEVEAIRAMVNMDSLGLGPTKMELTRADKALTHARRTGGLYPSTGERGERASSWKVGLRLFQDRHIPAIVIHSVTNETWPILHSRRDEMAAIRLTDYYDTYRLIAAYLAYLDTTLDAPSDPQN